MNKVLLEVRINEFIDFVESRRLGFYKRYIINDKDVLTFIRRFGKNKAFSQFNLRSYSVQNAAEEVKYFIDSNELELSEILLFLRQFNDLIIKYIEIFDSDEMYSIAVDNEKGGWNLIDYSDGLKVVSRYLIEEQNNLKIPINKEGEILNKTGDSKTDSQSIDSSINQEKLMMWNGIPLQWNGQKKVLVDIFSQLKILTNKKGEPLLDNSNPDIALFLKMNFRCYQDTDLSTILTTLQSKDSIPTTSNRIIIEKE